MPSPELTVPQSALLQAMHQVIASNAYRNYFQATLAQDTLLSIVFFPHTGQDVLTVRGAEGDFLALVQHGDIRIIHQGPMAYWGCLTPC